MSQERTRTICALGMRGVGQLSREALHALVVFPARFGPWVLAAARGTSAAAGEAPAVNAQSSGPRTFTCSRVLQQLGAGWRVLLWAAE